MDELDEFIAHIRESDKKVQTVKAHLLEVCELAETLGGKIGVKHIAGLAGLLHDLGKYTREFKEYIQEAVNNPNAPPRRGEVDHSTAGGKLLYEMFHTGPQSKPAIFAVLAEIVGNAIISHHSYLHDFLNKELESDYLRRVRDKVLNSTGEYERAKERFFEWVMPRQDFRRYVDEAARELETYLARPSSETLESKLMFLTKYVFSALIDADRTNTREFECDRQANKALETGARKELFEQYYSKLMTKLDKFKEEEDADKLIPRLRREMSECCECFALRPSGIYTLSIPTGGGKTLASFRYALRHAIQFGKQRIIYIVPYTTIIEQNAEELRKIVGDDGHLLEHHSNVTHDSTEDDEHLEGRISIQEKLKLAADNWDSPIIFTTMVQFLDVFYARGSRYIRRMHNLSEAVIIFDEVQKVPIHCVSVFNRALNFLKSYANSSLILCTATQPALDFVEHKLAIDTDAEIVDKLDQVTEAFKRVEMVDRATDETFDNEKLAEFVLSRLDDETRSVLVILNTRSVVKDLYGRLKDTHGVPVYHLSTSMCPQHRKDQLVKIKDHLFNKEQVICISTQLIEAGVDVSFACVIRSLAGLDSVAQAAGRCNRHGEDDLRQVYVIDHAEERLDRMPEIQIGKEIARRVLIDLKRDPAGYGGSMLSNRAMEKYFKELYASLKSKLNYPVPKLNKSMIDLLMDAKGNPDSYFREYRTQYKQSPPLAIANSYRTAADHFQAIEDYTAASVIAPYGEGRDLIAQLNGSGGIEDLSRLFRQAQRFTVSLFRYQLDLLNNNGGVVPLMEGKVLALTESAYDDKFGLSVENDAAMGFAYYS